MVWYSHHFKNFPQFVVIHTVKGFDAVNKAKVDAYVGLLLFETECLKNYGRRFVTLYRRQLLRPSPRKRNAKGKMIV